MSKHTTDEHKYDALKLENQICFPLYAASREVIKKYRPHLEELGLTYTQYVVLMVLWEERKTTVKELGERLHLDSGTLTPLLKNLEAAGYLTRARSEDDERVLNVELTASGMALRDKALDIPGKMAQCTSLTPEEAMQLYTLLHKLLDEPLV